jgi:hypothetical protein
MGTLRDNIRNKTLIKHDANIDFFMIVPPFVIGLIGLRHKPENLFFAWLKFDLFNLYARRGGPIVY